MDNIVIIGSSGHAKVIIDIVEREGRYKIAGLVDRDFKVAEQNLGYQVFGTEEDLPQFVTEHDLQGAIVAIGDNFIRAEVVTRVSAICPQLPFVSAIHPHAAIGKDVSIGDGSVIMSGVSVNPSCSIGRFCLLNTNSSIDHDSIMEEFSSLAPRATTGGNCRIGAYSAISIGAVLNHGVSIGEHTVVGAGSTVLKSIESNKVAYGVPARIVRDREAGEKYL